MQQKQQADAPAVQQHGGLQRAHDEETEDVLLKAIPILVLVFILLVGGAGAVIAAIVWPEWPATLWSSLSGPEPKAFWYLSRSSAMVAYLLLWASMATGLAITNKLMRVWPGGPTLAAVHEYASLLGLALAVFHALILLGDSYSQYTLGQILIPFASTNYRQFWVGIGQIALYLLIPVTLSFYVRRWIGYQLWRYIHYLSFGVFALALAHGLLSGSESGAILVRDMYWASVVSLIGLVAYRVVLQRIAGKAKAPQPI